MKSRWGQACIYTLVTLGVAHVLLLILGLLFGKQIGWFGLKMIWAHWEGTVSAWIAVGIGVILYFCIYAFCTKDND